MAGAALVKGVQMPGSSWPREACGYVPVLFTPYDDAGRIDYSAIEEDIEYILRFPHVAGLYVGSVYQEFWLLSLAERVELSRRVIDQIGGRVKVAVSASSSNEFETLSLAEAAIGHGADLVMLWPPFFGPRGMSETVDFILGVVERVEADFAIYNSGLPEVGFEFSPPSVARLAEHPAIVLIKEASLDLGAYLETVSLVGQNAVVSSPLEEYWLAGKRLLGRPVGDLVFGSSRFLWMQTSASQFICNFFSFAVAGRFEEAAVLLERLLPIARSLHTGALRGSGHPIGLIKKLRGQLGQSGGNPRPPLAVASDAEVQQAIQQLRGAGMVLESD